MIRTHEQKLIDNEAKFREFNEAIEKGYDRIETVAHEEGWSDLVSRPNEPFYFYCECSDEDCSERVLLTLERYTNIHQNRNRFVVRCGHEVPQVERVVEHGEDYCIVEKIKTPPEEVDQLQHTDVHNH